eukprot:338309-Pleurochrysis_carterae.AAC.1
MNDCRPSSATLLRLSSSSYEREGACLASVDAHARARRVPMRACVRERRVSSACVNACVNACEEPSSSPAMRCEREAAELRQWRMWRTSARSAPPGAHAHTNTKMQSAVWKWLAGRG